MKCLIHMIFGFEIFTEVCTIKLIFIIDRIIKNCKNFNHYERDAIINIIYIYIYIYILKEYIGVVKELPMYKPPPVLLLQIIHKNYKIFSFKC